MPHIIRNGPEWFKKLGKHDKEPGNKIYSVSGRVNRPGAFELPFGTPLGKIIQEHAGGMISGCRFKACLPGGASTRYLKEEFFLIIMDLGECTEILVMRR